MKKVVLIPDSFKGTMSSIEICGIMEKAIWNVFPGAEIVKIPVADGGEGSVDCFLEALGGGKATVPVKGPFFEETEGFYGRLPDGTAVIEMAAAAGLSLAGDKKDPELATSYGVGELIAAALSRGSRRIILGLGGSATNDGGCGMAAALGVRFLNTAGESFIPTGGTMKDIARIDADSLLSAARSADFVTMCDIDNPFFGKNGAAYVFGPQKGADAEAVKRLDGGLMHLAERIRLDLGKDVAPLPGAGAAGGMGGGSVAFLNAKLTMGIETILDVTHFDETVADADLVISGEGKIDAQSLRGKVVIGIAKRAKRAGVPLIAVVGDVGDGIGQAYGLGVTAVFSINRTAVPYREARLRSRADLEATVDNLMRFLAAFGC
ncbi:MAG: glycerate kinase [Clostridiales Family XIII bacterium]|jgi:glycerate kinase|nr:glycerate kinase [Clostridiales Family XIII bacterium]